MIKSHKREMLGVLGGMGPLASAEFLKTIYEYNILGQREHNHLKLLFILTRHFPIEQRLCSEEMRKFYWLI